MAGCSSSERETELGHPSLDWEQGVCVCVWWTELGPPSSEAGGRVGRWSSRHPHDSALGDAGQGWERSVSDTGAGLDGEENEGF